MRPSQLSLMWQSLSHWALPGRPKREQRSDISQGLLGPSPSKTGSAGQLRGAEVETPLVWGNRSSPGTSLVVHWLRIHLPMERMHVQSLA